ncbi:hypothetical protein SAMN06273572_11130 [Monaibacterium marinum]|uniref:Uncharacterized protein n=1 Tax=Pontivivens marinum TaxID=1690039 RepID=A0A2C9CVE8_9RHOB|nr:hypothetical protein [Monaibacterium marinum]SOH95451.1 hypothetical protein SAMN06273572_11130 [Monaibacterium marinum]
MPNFSMQPYPSAVAITGRASWTPAALESDVALWLDARSVTSSPGAPVSVWPDRSGHGRDVSSPQGAVAPVVGSKLLQGHDALLFDGTEMTVPNLGNDLPLSAFWVAFPQPQTSSVPYPSYFYVDGSGLRSDARKPMMNGLRDQPGRCTLWVGTVGHTVSFDPDSPHLGMVRSDLTHGYAAGVNGEAPNTKTQSPGLDPSSGMGGIGSSSGTCAWGEFLVLSVRTDAQTTQRIEGYLAHRWNLQSLLPVDHPHRGKAP